MLIIGLALAGTARAASSVAAQWYVAGNQLYVQKQYDKALQYFGQSLKLDNTQAPVYQAVGNCYYAKGDQANALKYYRYSLQLNPNNPTLSQYVTRMGAAQASAAPAGGAVGGSLAYGHQLYKAQQYSGALQAYKSVVAQEPSNAKAHQAVGNALYGMHDKAGALVEYRRALQLDPSNAALAGFISRMEGGGTQLAGAKDDWFQPAWRSAVLPGWGQFHNGESTKGLLLGGLTLGLLAGEVGTFVVGTAAKNEYLGLTGAKADYDTPYNTWSSMAQMNHIFFVGMTAAYVYTVVDAALGAGTVKTMQAAIPSNVDLAMSPDSVKMRVRLVDF